jgi:hypothetical protein
MRHSSTRDRCLAVLMQGHHRYNIALQATIKAIQRKTGFAELSLKDVPMDSFQVSCHDVRPVRSQLILLQRCQVGIIRLIRLRFNSYSIRLVTLSEGVCWYPCAGSTVLQPEVAHS